MIRLEMKNFNTTLTEKQQISALLTGKINKCEFLTGKVILISYRQRDTTSDQGRVIEQA